jgi:hypothetical protein
VVTKSATTHVQDFKLKIAQFVLFYFWLQNTTNVVIKMRKILHKCFVTFV